MITGTFKKIPITKPSITQLEIDLVSDAIANGWGSKCYDYIYRFERQFGEYLGTHYNLATSSCTGAIHIALMAMGIKAGDEVIVPDITWIASVEPVKYIGAKPVFVDVLEDSWCIDPEKFEKAITPKTRAVIVVHLYGNLVEMNSIIAIAKEYNIKILEDAAEGLGSEYYGKKAGSIGDAGVFSFHGTKTLSTGEGGMLVTNNKNIYDRAKILNDHGRDPKIGKTFWMAEYGYKYKMSNLQAAMGCAQLERVEELLSKKIQIFKSYKKLFENVSQFKMNPEPVNTRNTYWMPTVVVDNSVKFNRDELFVFLKEHNIDSRPFFYPLSSLPMFNNEIVNNPVSYKIYSNSFNLPSFHDMSEEEIIFVGETVLKFFSFN